MINDYHCKYNIRISITSYTAHLLNDLPIEVALFVDDTLVYQRFQQNLKALGRRAETWEMNFNLAKSKIHNPIQ